MGRFGSVATAMGTSRESGARAVQVGLVMQKTSTKTLFDYWNTLRGARSAPDRRDIDPAQIKSALANTFILELDERNEFSFRLAGSHLCAAYARELKGRSFTQLWHPRDRDAMGTLIRAVTADGLTNPVLANAAPYDLIVANILAGPLTQLAPSIQRALAPGAALVLSGLLHNQEGLVKSFYRSLRFVGARRDGPWSALVMEKAR